MKTALITGCSPSSVGASVALEFAKRPDWHVFATARDVNKLAHFDAYSNVTKLQLDVTSAASIAEAAAAVSSAAQGLLDVLVNNAGVVGSHKPVLDTDLDEYRAVFETNFFGPLSLCQTFAPMLVAAQGRIVNIGSTVEISNFIWAGAYTASKRAMASVSRTLHLELDPLGVTVINVVLGGVKTNILENRREWVLKSTSFYKTIEGEIKEARKVEAITRVMVPVGPVAEAIVQNALRPKPKAELWSGGLIWILWTLMMSGLMGWAERVASNWGELKVLRKQRASGASGARKEK